MGVIKKASSTQLIIDYVLDKIRTREWKPGDQLMNERAFSEELGVSRMPLREALSALSLVGILGAQQGSGTYIKKYDPEAMGRMMCIYSVLDDISIDDLFEVRAILESHAAQLAVLRASDEDLERMEAVLREGEVYMESLRDAPAGKEITLQKFHQLNFFHVTIAEAARNRYLMQFMDGFRALSGEYFERSSGDPLRDIQIAVGEHTAIYEAIRARDAEKAGRLMYEHLINEGQQLKIAM